MSARTTAEPASLRGEVSHARPHCPPVTDLNPLDALKAELPDWDIGETAGAYWAYVLEDGPQKLLLWGMTPGSLGDAIRADIAARGDR